VDLLKLTIRGKLILHLKTPKHFNQNASAFYLKHLSVFEIRRGEFIFRLRIYKKQKITFISSGTSDFLKMKLLR
jgi:hypothetical protein